MFSSSPGLFWVKAWVLLLEASFFPNRLVIWHAILKFILYLCKDLASKQEFFGIYILGENILKVSILCLVPLYALFWDRGCFF